MKQLSDGNILKNPLSNLRVMEEDMVDFFVVSFVFHLTVNVKKDTPHRKIKRTVEHIWQIYTGNVTWGRVFFGLTGALLD